MELIAHDTDDTELAPRFTVRDYKDALQRQDKATIAEAIRRRFTDRYIYPVRTAPKRGFTIMAVSCLMIEALECFRQGYETSFQRSKKAFCLFFDEFEPFKDLRGHVPAFYKHVRCGILHQAETTDGWRIRRDETPLFDATAQTVNANRFLEALEQTLNRFCDDLKTADWDSPQWKNVRKKMDAIVRNCDRSPDGP